MMKFLPLLGVILFSLMSHAAQDLGYRCDQFLNSPHALMVKKGRRGAPIHEVDRESWTLGEAAFDELDLNEITALLQNNAYTEYGRMSMEWLLSHPRLNSGRIREVQAAIKELNENKELAEA